MVMSVDEAGLMWAGDVQRWLDSCIYLQPSVHDANVDFRVAIGFIRSQLRSGQAQVKRHKLDRIRSIR